MSNEPTTKIHRRSDSRSDRCEPCEWLADKGELLREIRGMRADLREMITNGAVQGTQLSQLRDIPKEVTVLSTKVGLCEKAIWVLAPVAFAALLAAFFK